MSNQREEKKTKQIIHNKWEFLVFIKQIIFNLNEDNIIQSFNSLITKFDGNHFYSFNLVISQMIYIRFSMRVNYYEIYFDFIKKIEQYEENNNKPKILEALTSFLLDEHKYDQETFYILEYFIENNFIESKITKDINEPYFIQYMSEEEINELEKDNYFEQIQENYDKLSKNDWELHKQFIKEGDNTFGIAEIIRNDDVEKLQKISSQNDFRFNQLIKQSIYERCDFINLWNVSLIDYAAFFGSIKCFKYLLMNDADVYYTGKYAIASGNAEIIHLCEQNHASFKGAYETAIKFHQNDIFKYIFEKKLEKLEENDQFQSSTSNNDSSDDSDDSKAVGFNAYKLYEDNLEVTYSLEKLGKFCILYHNYEIFSFLLENGMKIDDDIINESARIGNIFLVEYFQLNYKIPKNILSYSSYSGNIELVKYILKQKGIDINGNDEDGYTSLINASGFGYIEIVKLLLEQKGIDINAKTDDGTTALTLASEKGHIEIVKLLLEQEGIDINAKDNNGNTALMKATSKGHIEIVNLLLEQEGIDINAKDNNENTALISASSNGHIEIVKLLLEQKGIDINAKNNDGNTALIYASSYGDTEIVKLLLEQEGIDINEKEEHSK